MTDYQNILIIKLGALGDWIHMTGWFRTVREQWPKAHITLMTGSSFLKLAKTSPFFDDYIVDNRTWRPWDYLHITTSVLANGGYDLIIDMQKQTRTKKRYYSLARFFTKGPFIWASIEQKGLNLRITPVKKRFTWGTETNDFLPLHIQRQDLSFCKANPEIIKSLPKQYVLFVPGCSPTHPYKRWPATFYHELGLKLAKTQIHTVVLGTNAERFEIEQICQGNPMALNFCNKTSLLDIPEISGKALAVVGNDTGPQHMAELGTTPAITLFCDITKNSSVKRDNVTNLIAQNIQDISVEKVYETLQSLWHSA